MDEEKTYVIKCPHCGSTFDFHELMKDWKLGLVQAVELLKEVQKLVNKIPT